MRYACLPQPPFPPPTIPQSPNPPRTSITKKNGNVLEGGEYVNYLNIKGIMYDLRRSLPVFIRW